MRTLAVLSLLLLAGCSAPDRPFPNLADLPEPKPLTNTQQQRERKQNEIENEGAVTREAGEMVRQGEELSRPLPK